MRTTLAIAWWPGVAALALGIAGPPESYSDDQQTRAEKGAVTDAGLTHLKNLSEMKSLTLAQMAVTDAGLVQLED